jgi:hypothetical protein
MFKVPGQIGVSMESPMEGVARPGINAFRIETV